MPFGPEYGAPPLSSEAANEQAWAVVALHVEVLVGATEEETRFFAVIDPTFWWLGRLPQLRTGIARLLVRTRSHLIY